MSAQIAIHGRLGSDPVERTSNSGTTWATASIAVSLSNDDEGGTVWFGIVAFGKVAEALCRQSKGDMVSASGRLQLNRWTDKENQQREQLQVVADTIISARTVRPGRPAASRSSTHG